MHYKPPAFPLHVSGSSLTRCVATRMGVLAARGEFNFQVADTSHSKGILSDANYSGVTWSLLLVTLLTPLWFRVAFRSPPQSASAVPAASCVVAVDVDGAVVSADDPLATATAAHDTCSDVAVAVVVA
jgi:hypothetical protein